MIKKYRIGALLIAVILGTVVTPPALGIDGFYIGGQLGHVGLTEPASRTFSNTIGIGVDLGVRTNPLLDLVLQLQRSGHSGGGTGLTLVSQTLSADFHFWEFNDFEFSLGGGPGFYFFNATNSDTNFGLHVGSNVDVVVDDHVRVGLGLRFHGVFANGGNASSYWTAMMRVGYLFTAE